MKLKASKYNAILGFIYLKGEAMSAFCEALPTSVYNKIDQRHGEWTLEESKRLPGIFCLKLTQEMDVIREQVEGLDIECSIEAVHLFCKRKCFTECPITRGAVFAFKYTFNSSCQNGNVSISVSLKTGTYRQE